MKIVDRTTTPLFLIIVLGVALRFFELGNSSFWLDEIYTVHCATRDILGHSLSHPPLFYLIVRLFIQVFGENEFIARLPACIFGCLTIPVVYLHGKQLFNRKTGLIAAFIVSISLWHIQWSQMARMYSGLAFFSLLAIYFFYDGVKNGRYRSLIIATICLILAVYTHYTALFLLPVMLLYILFSKNRLKALSWKNIIICFTVFLILYSPITLDLIGGVKHKLEENIVEGGIRWGLSLSELLQSLFINKLGVTLLLLSLIGAISLFIKKDDSVYLLITFIMLPLITFSLFLLLGVDINVSPRYLIFTLPAYAILASYGFLEILNKISKHKFLVISFSLLVILFLNSWTAYVSYYKHREHPNWKSAGLYVKSNMDSEDMVVGTVASPIEYYVGRLNFSFRYMSSEVAFNSITNSTGRIWVIIDYWRINWLDPKNKIIDWLDSNCDVKKEVEFITVYLCE